MHKPTRRRAARVLAANRSVWVVSTHAEVSAVKIVFFASAEYHTGTGETSSHAAAMAAARSPRRGRVQPQISRTRTHPAISDGTRMLSSESPKRRTQTYMRAL